jgi:hypothetical protein
MHKRPNDLGDVANNLEGVMNSLHAWSERTIGSIPMQLDKKLKDLESLQMCDDAASKRIAKRLSAEIDELLEKDEIRWRQRCRVSWLREGDRNTSFFHRKVSWRQKKN